MSNIGESHQENMHSAGTFGLCAVLACTMWSFVHSASLACEDLVRPLVIVDTQLLSGRWALISGGLADQGQLSFFKRRDSASIDVSVCPGRDISYTPKVNVEGKCHSSAHNVTLEGSTVQFRDKGNISVNLLYTSCADCLLLRFDNSENTVMRAYLFSRNREVSQEERMEFTAQMACLNMLPPVWLDPSKALCPKETAATQEACP